MVLKSARIVIPFLLVLALSAPAAAHKEHQKQQATKQVGQPATASAQGAAATNHPPTAMHAELGEIIEDKAQVAPMSFSQRLFDWLGRLHPAIVHFPIAFFPAALFTALVGRRHPAFASPVQFLVVAGGVLAPIAAALGWLDAIGAESDALLTAHRWLGTAIGVAALPIGIWAWRKPEQDRSTGMIVALAAITAAMIVQGWYGGALVHGIDHLNW
jgi:uncharacterized membrane protein